MTRYGIATLAVFIFATLVQADVDHARDVTQGKSDEKSAQLPHLPDPHLTPITGFNDDEAFLFSVTEEVQGLLKSADEAVLPKDRVDFQLTAANLILARGIEPACSRELLGIRDPGDETYGNAPLRTSFDQADKILKQAGESLTVLARDPKIEPKWQAESKETQETLLAFSLGLRALLTHKGANDADIHPRMRRTRRATLGLSPFLEDRRPAVAEAARLWQTSLRASTGRSDRALASLSPALLPPNEDTLPYAFFSRLLRCRMLAKRDEMPVALALLMQIEDRCEEWLPTETERQDAIRTTQFTQLQLLSQWFDQLQSSDNPKNRAWCTQRQQELIESGFGTPSDTLFRLSYAIPILVQEPASSQSSSPDKDDAPFSPH